MIILNLLCTLNKIITFPIYIDITVALVASAVLFALTFMKKTLTIPATALACAMMMCISICSSYREIVFLMLSYIILIIIDIICSDKSEEKIKDVHQKTGARSAVQIIANGSAATIAAILLYATHNKAFLYAYIICVSEACADSVASDVGVLSSKNPISILTLKKVPVGMSGGISFLGMTASFAGCIVMALLACISLGFSWRGFLITVFVPYLGMIIDSILGAALQTKMQCAVCGKSTEKKMHCDKPTIHIGGLKHLDNSAVNIITNFITGAIGFFAASVLL